MLLPDLINGSVEAVGAFFVVNHCRVLLRDRCVRGVSVASTVFFTLWGVWNLYFYPHLGQVLSFCGSIAIVVSNGLYIALIVYFRHVERRQSIAAGDELEDAVTLYWRQHYQALGSLCVLCGNTGKVPAQNMRSLAGLAPTDVRDCQLIRDQISANSSGGRRSPGSVSRKGCRQPQPIEGDP